MSDIESAAVTRVERSGRVPGLAAKKMAANVSVMRAICCDSPGRRKASRKSRMASATDFYSRDSGLLVGLRVDAMRGTRLKLLDSRR